MKGLVCEGQYERGRHIKCQKNVVSQENQRNIYKIDGLV